jgi:general L-amino acid transport system substrate-binding protein
MPGFKKRSIIVPIIVLLVCVFATAHPSRAQTLSAVKERGTLNCGVSQGLLGFSSKDDKGVWAGFDADF